MRGRAELTTENRSLQDLARRNLPWLYVGRWFRSFGLAFLTVVFPLYLAGSGYSSTTVGAVLTVGSVLSALLALVVGLLGDRVGRRPMLLLVAGLGVVGGVLLVVTNNLFVVTLASGLGGVGRGGGAGSGGANGAFFPAEQPLLAGSVPSERRTWAFGRLGAIGVAGGALGSLVAWVPDALHAHGMSQVGAYRVVFLIGAVLSVVVVAVTLPIREPPRLRATEADAAAPTGDGAGSASTPASTPASSSDSEDRSVAEDRPEGKRGARSTISTGQVLGRLTLTNGLNGLGFGFLGPLLTYWFHVRFGVSSGDVGTVYFAINVATIAPYLGAARLVRRLGSVRAVVVTRFFGTAALLGMAFVGSFELAAALYAIRGLFNSLGNPARQSYVMGVAEEERRGMVAAVGTLPSQATSSISPLVGGAMMTVVEDFPIFGAAVFMFLNVGAYYFVFRNVGERTEPVADEQGGLEPAAALRRRERPGVDELEPQRRAAP